MPANIQSLLKKNGNKYKEEWIEEYKNEYSAIINDPGRFQDKKYKRIDIDKTKGIFALIGKLRGKSTTTVRSYRFLKDNWTKGKIVSWLNKRMGSTKKSELYKEKVEDHWEVVFNTKGLEDESPFKSKKKLDEIVANYDINYHEAPLLIDHNTNKGALGWIKSLKRVGSKLFASFSHLSEEAINLIKNKAYKYKSIGIIDYPDKGSYLHELSLTNFPRVKGLGAFKLPENNAEQNLGLHIINYSENDNVSNYEFFDKEVNPTMEKELKELKEKYSELESGLKNKDNEIEDLKKEKEKYKEENEKLNKEKRKLQYKERLDSLVSKGNILPSQVEKYGNTEKMAEKYVETFSDKQFEEMLNMFNVDKVNMTEKITKEKPLNVALNNKKSDKYNEILAYGKSKGKEEFKECLDVYIKEKEV